MRGEIKEIVLDFLNTMGYRGYRIILFGSRARKDFEEESDWDIFIILEDELTGNHTMEVRKKTSRALHKLFPLSSFDIIIKSKGLLKRKSMWQTPYLTRCT
jgi:predicted nucleotidyltransferase